MKRSAIVAALAVSLSGCASAPPPQQASTFSPAEAKFATAKGVATVKGQSFLRRNDGVVVYGAGNDVMLVPRVSQSEEAIQAGFKGAKIHMEVKLFGANVMGNDYRFDPAMDPYIRRTKADGQGNFAFEAVPPRSYYVLSRVTWCVPTQYGCNQQGGDLVETVNITPTDKLLTAMLTGT